MATVDEAPPVQAPDVISPVDASGLSTDTDTLEDASLKRRASADRDLDSVSPKRARYADADTNAHQSRRRVSPPRDRLEDVASSIGQERLKSATQEEKKRGKRLFGGLLSTLSQTSTNSQQKRRLEIEKKQQERLQKQKAEEDQKIAEKRGYWHDIRMTEQMVFEEKVIQTKHAKKLSTAQYLRTKAEPHIYYLPWKRTPEQDATIDEQIREVKASIEMELAAFEVRKQDHVQRYGQSQRSHLGDEPSASILKADTTGPISTAQESEKPATMVKEQDDESTDILVEADEDAVLY